MYIEGDAAHKVEEVKKYYGISSNKDVVTFILLQEYRRMTSEKSKTSRNVKIPGDVSN